MSMTHLEKRRNRDTKHSDHDLLRFTKESDIGGHHDNGPNDNGSGIQIVHQGWTGSIAVMMTSSFSDHVPSPPRPPASPPPPHVINNGMSVYQREPRFEVKILNFEGADHVAQELHCILICQRERH